MLTIAQVFYKVVNLRMEVGSIEVAFRLNFYAILLQAHHGLISYTNASILIFDAEYKFEY